MYCYIKGYLRNTTSIAVKRNFKSYAFKYLPIFTQIKSVRFPKTLEFNFSQEKIVMVMINRKNSRYL